MRKNDHFSVPSVNISIVVSPSDHFRLRAFRCQFEPQVNTMRYTMYERLVRRGILSGADLENIIAASSGSASVAENLLTARGVPKHELLLSLAEYFDLAYREYDESVIVPRQVLKRIDAERLKKDLWFPLSVQNGTAQVLAADPADPAIVDNIRKALAVDHIEFIVALPSDLIRIIEHNQDLNPGFPPAAGRTPLAKVRTFLADRRSLYAGTRTNLARGRTGLAFLRTGVSSITMSVVLYRVFGAGYLSIVELVLLAAGIGMAFDGIRWYLPVRKAAGAEPEIRPSDPSGGSSVLTSSWEGSAPRFVRSEKVLAASELREEWSSLSPVMRRRFLASDRTDYAEERTLLALIRTKMARARTGLAFTRTGVALAGLGIALIRLERLHTPGWAVFDAALICLGGVTIIEGLWWYVPGRKAGIEGARTVRALNDAPRIWDTLFPPSHRRPAAQTGGACVWTAGLNRSPGIWATTGLALERTVLAERRNVMARLRTVMARSRTGLAFIRTGMAVSAVGAGLLVSFGAASAAWTALEVLLILGGALFIVDGLYWHLPAENMRKELPYCFCDLEIAVPDYGKPARTWARAVFSHDDL